MLYIPADQDVRRSSAESCLNLWYFGDNSGISLRLEGKAYALTGSEEEKSAMLRRLSSADHLTATLGKVPAHFVVTTANGEAWGATLIAGIQEKHGEVFDPLMDQIERELPKGIRSVDNTYEYFDLKLPQDPLCVTTAVLETPEGELVASTGKRT